MEHLIIWEVGVQSTELQVVEFPNTMQTSVLVSICLLHPATVHLTALQVAQDTVHRPRQLMAPKGLNFNLHSTAVMFHPPFTEAALDKSRQR